MADPNDLYDALRVAARATDARLLVGLADGVERARIAAALGAEGVVEEAAGGAAALVCAAAHAYGLIVVDAPLEAERVSAAAVGAGGAPDLLLVSDPDPALCTAAFAAGAEAVLPRPLPPTDSLLRSHMRWLAACRRQRARAWRLRGALRTWGGPLSAAEPALAQALSEIAAADGREPAVLVIGDGDLLRIAGGRAVQTSAEVAVIGVTAADDMDSRLQEARARAGGAAIVVVDAAPTRSRPAAALYAGARAYVDRGHMESLGRIVAAAAAKRRAEVVGRRLVETLARFGALAEAGRAVPTAASRDARALADAAQSSATFVPSGHDILVVDDDLVVVTLLREALRRGGYRVTTAASAEEAIALLRRRTFDLVLTDKNLPGASGLEIASVARTLDPPPGVVLMTGYSSYDAAVAALDTGALDYIEKPIRDLETLRFRIRRALSRRDELMSRREIAPSARAARVLLVEIEGSRRALMAELLGRRYRVTAVSNGDEALALLERQHHDDRFDLVLADRNLPGMSGLRVIEQAQRLLPHCASVLYTAYPSYETVKEAFEAGVDAYLVRPSEDLSNLSEKIEGALRSRGGILLG